MRLRGHHLFCAALFRGRGYDGRFTACMTRVVDRLEQGAQFLVVEGADDLCKACPHLAGGSPDRERCGLGTEDVLHRDQLARKVLGLVSGQVADARELGCRLRKVTPSQWDQVCRGCRWQKAGICSWEAFSSRRRFV